MKVTLGSRLGGPEVGARLLSEIVTVRPRWQSLIEPVIVPGVDLLDVELFVGGSITDHCPDNLETTIRYFKNKRRILVTICVPRELAAEVEPAALRAAVAQWLVDGVGTVPTHRSTAGLEFGPVVTATAALLS